MGKNLKYGEFDFGPVKVHVKGYARGGPVKSDCACEGKPAPGRKSVPVAPPGPLFGKKR